MKKKFGNVEIQLDEKRIQKKIEAIARKKYPDAAPYNPDDRLEKNGL